MKRSAALLMFCLAAWAGVGAAQEQDRSAGPNAEYCSRRDADPKKCVIQDGPPNPNIIIRKPPPPPPPPRSSVKKLPEAKSN